MALRLIPGRGGWWALHGRRAAHLPHHAVVPAAASVGHDARTGVDLDRGRVLVPEALGLLQAGGFFTAPESEAYAVTVLTATACNLGCDYCFQNTAVAGPTSFAPPRIERAVLDRAAVADTVDFVRRQQRAGGLERVSLLLFGGEPLLNPHGCLQLLQGLRPLGLADAEMVTNGVLLTERLAGRLHRAGLARLQITFDGARASHDRIRVTRNGRATYDTILANVLAASSAAPGLRWNFRVNVSHRNTSGLEELVDELAPVAAVASGASFHLALIDDVGLGYDNAVGYDDELAELFVRVNRRAVEAGLSVQASRPLSDCPYCSVVGGGRGAVVNADGTLYSCWENAGRTDWAVGSTRSGYDDPETVAARWVACDFDISSHGDVEATRAFFDRVDAAALDDQRELAALVPAV